MPSKRYFIAIIPVQHINGKMSRVVDKCPDTDNPDADTGVSFYYGYRRKSTPGVSRFGLREKGRDLTAHPYTPTEILNRELMRSTFDQVAAHRAVPDDWALMLQDFRLQHQYSTPSGYAVAMVRKNGGEWLTKWTS